MVQEIKRNLPRDVFLHLLSVVTLYWSSITFVTLVWQFINYFFPDVLNGYSYMGFAGPIRFAISSLIIVFPVFILVSWYLNKIYKKESEVRESKIRKWLIYLTIFISSLVIIGDLVSIINMLLGGEITVRFILKAISVLLVAGVIFGYYLDDVRKETPTKSAKYFALISGFIVLVAVIGSFFIVGSPATARLMQFDEQKVSELQGIQYQIVNYWQSKEKLPENLSELNDKISGYQVPDDPQLREAKQEWTAHYEYEITDSINLSFKLCAVFNRISDQNASPYKYGYDMVGQNWDHPAGRFCFERTIDKELYPPMSKIKN